MQFQQQSKGKKVAFSEKLPEAKRYTDSLPSISHGGDGASCLPDIHAETWESSLTAYLSTRPLNRYHILLIPLY